MTAPVVELPSAVLLASEVADVEQVVRHQLRALLAECAHGDYFNRERALQVAAARGGALLQVTAALVVADKTGGGLSKSWSHALEVATQVLADAERRVGNDADVRDAVVGLLKATMWLLDAHEHAEIWQQTVTTCRRRLGVARVLR